MRKFLTFLLIPFFAAQLTAQCSLIEQTTKNTASPTTNVDASTIIGQSFKSCRDGQLNTITINVTLPIGVTEAKTTLSVAAGETTNSGILHTQAVTISASGEVVINLTNPVKVKNNQTYTFFFGGSGDAFGIAISSSLGDTYTEGALLQGNTPLVNTDLFFKLALGAIPIVAPIPTMSEWGLLVLALLILNLGIFYVQQTESILLAK